MKRVKYLFAAIILFSAALCSAMFCGCGESGQENQTQENMIEDIYYNKYGYNFVYDEYYGVFDGAEVYFQSGDMTVVKSIKVADCVFKYNNDWNIYVFKDSDVYKLEEAYQTGILSAQTVSEIAERHKQYAKANSGQSDDEFESWYYEEDFYLENSALMSLEEAFDMGYLTENDLMYISYYLNGSVYKVPSGSDDINDKSKWIKVDFIPEHAIPALGSEIEEKIKTAYYYNNLQYFQDENGNLKYGKDILEVEYFGCYNNVYVARVDSEYWSYGAVLQTVKIGDIIWQQNAPSVKVLLMKNNMNL